jgi:hypothetical protein
MRVMRSATVFAWAMAQVLPAWSIDYCDTEVRVVKPGAVDAAPPADAIVLFDGKDLSQWKGVAGPAAWDVHDGILTVHKGTGDIETRQSFQDIQLHLEWRIPTGTTGEGQHRGNSGVFLMGRYEIQILDSYNSRTYANGQAGSVYGQASPLVNAIRPPGEWNSYDVMFTAPRFNTDGTVFSAARVTVLHNGLLIHNNTEVLGATGAWGRPGYYEVLTTGPIRLQDHRGPGDPISFRNVWVRELNARRPAAGKDGAAAATRGLEIVSHKTVEELVADPVARAVLVRCVPELVPNPAIAQYVAKQTLVQLKGEADITLTDERLRLIDAELARAQADSGK